MNAFKYISIVTATLLTLALAGCQTGTVTDPRQIVFPDTNVSYARSVQPLFDLSCAQSGCHGTDTRAGGLSLASYIGVLERPGVVVPGDSAKSVLVQIMGERLPHSAYPINQLITNNHRRGVAQWIQEGAHDN